MFPIQKVAIFGAGGTIGSHITKALAGANFTITIITRPESDSKFPDGLDVVRTEYTVSALTDALRGQDAVISAVGFAGISKQADMMDAAEAAGVRRFIVSDFGYGPHHQSLPEFEAIGKPRMAVLERAREKAAANPDFTWSAVAIGMPVDWALKKFTTMGFDVVKHTAIIYDAGTEHFTGTTMAGIAQAVLGIVRNPEETKNKHLRVRSVRTCQNELLSAFEVATGEKWSIMHDTSAELMRRGREKLANGDRGWILDLIVAQLFEEGAGRSIVVADEEADNDLLGMPKENVETMAKEIMESV